MKAFRKRLALFIAALGLWLLYLMVELGRRLWGIRAESLNTTDTLSLVGVIISGAALSVAVPGVWLVVAQLRRILARPELIPQYIVRLRPRDQATDPNYYVEVSLYNSSDVTAHHFRFLCYCYTPTNPGDPRRQPWPVNVIPSHGIPDPPLDIDVNNYATMLQLLPAKNPPGMSLVRGWELRASGLYIYPKDRLLIATIEVFGPNLSFDWRLDSESAVKKGNARCPRPTA